jgi:hypothetical protein
MSSQTGTMTNEERLVKTIRLEKTDRMLVGPAIGNFAATYTGQTIKDLMGDPERAAEAYERTFNELGGWDIISSGGNSVEMLLTNHLRARLPGRELPDDAIFQYVEEEVMTPEDYDFVIANGFKALNDMLYWRNHPEQTPEQKKELLARAAKRSKEHNEKWAARGLARLHGGIVNRAFGRFSAARSFAKFAMDMRRMPDKVKAAIEASRPDIIAEAKQFANTSGCRRLFVGGSRDSSTFIGPKQFEEFVFPDLKEIVYALTDDNIDIVFHLDNDWTDFLPYFKEFPKGRCIIDIDGSTDAFKAKKILNGHMAIMGDVQPGLLTLGTPEQVYAYCKRLIEEVGDGGAFVLDSGCELPYNSKPENVKALLQAGRELTWHN